MKNAQSPISRCRVCRRPLSDPDSILQGVGPECAAKYQWMLCDAGLTAESLQIPEQLLSDPSIALWLRRAEQALLAGRRSDMERFKSAAKDAARGASAPALAAAS